MTTMMTSCWPADVSEPVLETTVGGILRAAAAAQPGAPAMVAGVPDPAARRRWTFVRAVPGQPAPSIEELRTWCRERLAPYKTPAHWVFTDAFPMTPSGKIQKFKLRESFTGPQPG